MAWKKHELDSSALVVEGNRSQAFNIIPIGQGSVLLESHTSYLQRLARRHCISVRRLLFDIAPELRRRDGAHALIGNWAGDYERIGRVLERATKRSDLLELTPSKWNHLVCRSRLLRRHTAWCSSCLRDSDSHHIPLLWTLQDVRACPIHHEILETRCPQCRRQRPPTRAEVRFPECECGFDLRLQSDRPRRARGWHLRIAAEVGDLIAHHSLEARSIGLHELIDYLVIAPFSTTASASAYYGFHHNYLYQVRAIGRTTLENLCRLALGSGMRLHQLVLQTSLPLAGRWERPIGNPTFGPRKRHSRATLEAEVQAQLEFDLEPRSIREIARQVGVATTTIRVHCPPLFSQLKTSYARHRATRTARAIARIREKIRSEKDFLASMPRSVAVRELGFVRNYRELVALLDESL